LTKTELAKILNALKRMDVPFVLAGAHAVAAWGMVRSTRDIDFLVDVRGDLAGKLASGLKEAGLKTVLRKGDDQDPLRGVIRIESSESASDEPVEIVLGIRGMPKGIFDRASSLDFLGLRVPVISPEDLIVLKLLAGGPIDLENARSILEIMKGKLDMKYLEGELKRCRLSIAKLKK